MISLQKYLKNYAKFDSFYLNKSIRFFFQAYSLYDSNFSSSTEYKPGRNLNNKKNHLSFSTSHFLQLCYSPGFIINSYNFLKTHTNKHIQSNLLLTANSSQRPLFYNGNLFWRTDHTSTVFFFLNPNFYNADNGHLSTTITFLAVPKATFVEKSNCAHKSKKRNYYLDSCQSPSTFCRCKCSTTHKSRHPSLRT